MNCWSIIRHYQKWKQNQVKLPRIYLGSNLIVANFLILLIYCPSQIAWLITIDWRSTEIACKIRMFIVVFAYHMSSYATVIIALDLFFTFYKSLKRYKSNVIKRTKIMILVSFVAATVTSCSRLFTWGLLKVPNTKFVQCIFLYHENLLSSVIYESVYVVTVFYIPLVIIISCYVASGICIIKQLRQRQALQKQDVLLKSYNRRKLSRTKLKIKSKFIRRSTGVICCYVVCWLPYQIISVWTLVARKEGNSNDYLSQYLTWLDALVVTNTCINSFLYI